MQLQVGLGSRVSSMWAHLAMQLQVGEALLPQRGLPRRQLHKLAGVRSEALPRGARHLPRPRQRRLDALVRGQLPQRVFAAPGEEITGQPALRVRRGLGVECRVAAGDAKPWAPRLAAGKASS